MADIKPTHLPTLESLHKRVSDLETKIRLLEKPINPDEQALRSEKDIIAQLKKLTQPTKVQRACQLIRKYQK
jgi:hypothetical protein